MAETVLVVEDEKDIRDLLRRYLERAGLTVLTTGSGAQALTMVADRVASLVVLDLGLPDVDGVEVLRAAREAGATPVVVLTARGAVEDRIRGLELGADDYVTKPFSPKELVLRVQAVLHRAGAAVPAVASFANGRLLIDEPRHEVRWNGEPLELTPTEWGLLAVIAAVPGRVYSRYELINQVRGYEFEGYERTVDSHVKNLRHKFGECGPEVVQTVHGVGYRLGLRRDR
ncbi:response regulator transcription factor [Lentzea sp. HUAS TT2]|uniref:response regulator transcription factor n=1 Tax=Lentzea sp. HUAS TT2 TaxID=3447454 RepID=UPI003F7303DB